MSQKGVLFALMIAAIVGACSIIKKEDPAQAVRTFLSSFQSNLSKQDQEILKQFRVRQSPEAVLAVIRILQNKEKYFRCDAQFGNANIFITPTDIQVTIPAKFATNGLENHAEENATLEFWLKREGKSFVITRLEADAFYNTFTSMKNRNEWSVKRKNAVESRGPIYAKARELENKFDTVIFYATYKDENYFYVVEGEWKNYFLRHDSRHEKNTGSKMGLANSNGELIIPMEYDMIGTIAFEMPDLVEVKKDGKVGYFNLQTKTLIVEPKYDMIIPASFDSTFAIVKQDTVFGWLTKEYTYQQGFPSEDAENWFRNYAYLRKNLRLAAGSQVLCEIPLEDYAGSGIVMPSSYLVNHTVFDEIEHGIVTTEIPMNAYSEYKETRGSWLQRITDGLSTLTTSIQERYLEGREEFYTSSTIVFIDNNYETLGVTRLAGSEISMRAIDSTLLEVKTPHDWWFIEEYAWEESNLYHHTYFAIAEKDSIIQLKSNRLFPETEFVKFDSSYVTGQFLVYNHELQRDDITSMLSLKTLTYMRDEILASYSYSFPGEERTGRFSPDWYTPVYDNISEFAVLMSDVDRHNLEFLERLINPPLEEQFPAEADTNIYANEVK